MTPYSDSHDESYHHFLTEAQDLLASIEHDLLTLRGNQTKARVHSLMRAAHTLKGAAASIDRDAIREVAHVMEDIFSALYSPNAVIDDRVEGLLFQGYECLRILLSAELGNSSVDEADVLNRAASIIADLQEILGDCFQAEAPVMHSTDLGFDLVQSMFETGVANRLTNLGEVLQQGDPSLIVNALKTHVDVFIGLAESLNLPGFGAIATTTLDALKANPDQVERIAQVALEDFSAGKAGVLEGDRTQGGTPSPQLVALAHPNGDKVSASGNMDEFDVFDLEMDAMLGLDNPAKVDAELNSAFEGEGEDEFDFDFEEDDETDHSPPPDHDSDSNLHATDDLDQGDNIDFSLLIKPESSPENPNSARDTDTLLDELIESQSADTTANTTAHVEFEDVFELVDDEPELARNGEAIDAPHKRLTSPISETQDSPASSPSSLVRQDNQPNPFSLTSTHRKPSPSAPNTQRIPQRISPSIRVDLTHLHQLEHLSGELLIQQTKHGAEGDELYGSIRQLQAQLNAHLTTLHDLQDELEELQASRLKGQQMAIAPHSNKESFGFDALEMDNYSHQQALAQAAIDQAYQLESAMTSITQITKRSKHTVTLQRRLLTNLQDNITATRMQSLGLLMQRFPRLIQQLTATYGKQAELVMEGTDVLVDRVIVEKLYDPLLHIIRNAFDHGLEPEEERRALGKSPTGCITIRAFNQGSNTVIEVSDDGRGISPERIGQRAIALNLTTTEQLALLSAPEILDFLFYPGFSTATQVSDLSGRGVGMDVVRAELQAMKGTITIHSEPNQGTTFRLALPFSLTVASLLLCEVDDTLYAFPISSTERVFLAKPEHLHYSADQTLTLILSSSNTQAIRVYRISDLLGYSASQQKLKTLADNHLTEQRSTVSRSLRAKADSDTTHSAQTSPILLIRTADGLRGILIDRVQGEQDLVIRPLSPMIPAPPFIHGCCILSDNQLALVIDAITLLQQTHSAASLSQPESVPVLQATSSISRSDTVSPSRQQPFHLPHGSGRLPTVLVVDDSATVRYTLAATLKQAGYQVFQARDGLDAIAQLEQIPSPAAIICDIEMPRCNGFEFLTQTRRNPSLSKIPVVILTSRQSGKHQQIALELGATAYLTKPYNNRTVIDTVSQVMGDRPLLSANKS